MANARIEIKNEKRIKLALKRLGDQMPEAIRSALLKSTLYLQGVVKEKKLSGQILRVQTGRLRSSIATQVLKVGQKSFVGIVGTNVVYAPVHEFGSRKRNIKKRPFLTPTFTQEKERVREIFRSELDKYFTRQMHGLN